MIIFKRYNDLRLNRLGLKVSNVYNSRNIFESTSVPLKVKEPQLVTGLSLRVAEIHARFLAEEDDQEVP